MIMINLENGKKYNLNLKKGVIEEAITIGKKEVEEIDLGYVVDVVPIESPKPFTLSSLFKKEPEKIKTSVVLSDGTTIPFEIDDEDTFIYF